MAGGTTAGRAPALHVQGPGFHPQHCYKEQKESYIQSLTLTLILPPRAGFPGLVCKKLTERSCPCRAALKTLPLSDVNVQPYSLQGLSLVGCKSWMGRLSKTSIALWNWRASRSSQNRLPAFLSLSSSRIQIKPKWFSHNCVKCMVLWLGRHPHHR